MLATASLLQALALLRQSRAWLEMIFKVRHKLGISQARLERAKRGLKKQKGHVQICHSKLIILSSS